MGAGSLNKKRRERYNGVSARHDRFGKRKAHRLNDESLKDLIAMKSYDVHIVYEYVHHIEAESAREAKAIAEASGRDDCEQVSGPDVVAVLEITRDIH